MSRVTWGAPSERYFETGVDRGVLYPNSDTAIAWTGLTAVNETTRGGEPRPTYIDGIKIRNLASKEEYEATIEAFTAPREFDLCDGRMEIQKGLIATNQRRKAFGFSYRTRIGNALDGPEHGYKIHLVYNAMAGPSERNHATIGDSTEAEMLSWPITTRAPFTSGIRPTAHFVIDTRYTPKGLLAAIENMLYGNDVSEGRLPLISELITMFKDDGPLQRTNLVTNPSYRATSGTVEVRRNMIASPTFKYDAGTQEVRRNVCLDPNGATPSNWSNYVGVSTIITEGAAAYSGSTGITATSDGTQVVPRIQQAAATTVAANETWTLQCRVRLVAGTGWAAGTTPYIILRGGKTSGGEWSAAYNPPAASLSPDANGWYDMKLTGIVDAATDTTMRINIGFSNGSGTVAAPSGAKFQVDQIILEKSYLPLPWFDGSKASHDGLTYSWTGVANNSPSISSGPAVFGSTFKGYLRNNWRVPGGATDGTDSCVFYLGTINTSLFMFDSGQTALAVAGDYVSARFRVRLRNATGPTTLSANIFAYSSANAAISSINAKPNIVVPADGSWVDVLIDGYNAAPANTYTARLYVTGTNVATMKTDMLEISNVLVEKTSKAFSWFDGSKPAGDGLTYSWTGTPHASPSIATGKSVVGMSSGGSTVAWQGADGASLRMFQKVRSYGANFWYTGVPVIAGDWVSGALVAASDTGDKIGYLRAVVYGGTGGDVVGANLTLPTDGVRHMVSIQTPANGTNLIRIIFYTNAEGFYTLRDYIIEKSDVVGPFFDGSTPDEDFNYYSWTAAADASTSQLHSWN